MINRKIILGLAALSALLTSGLASAESKMVRVNGELRPAYREGEVIVKYKDGVARTARDIAGIYQRIDVLDVKRFSGAFKSFEQLVFNSSRHSVEEVVADLQRDPSVEYAQPNYMVYAMPAKLAKPKTVAQPCVMPGIPYPPGCDDSGSNPSPTPAPNPGDGNGKPCLMPGIPFPPGCDDSGSPSPSPSPSPAPGGRPAIVPAPADVNPAVPDPDMSSAWGITKVGADKAWATQRGSRNVLVAVIDTGIDYSHPDLTGNIWHNPNKGNNGIDPAGGSITGDEVGWDFVHNDNLPFDDNQHGTHCAGVIGAVGGNGNGISGVNQKVSIMAVKFLSGEGSGDSATAIKAIEYAVSRGAKVLSNSWGGKGDDGNNAALKDAIERAKQKGVLFVAAAGNDSTDNDSDPAFPASFDNDNMVTVAATNESDGLAFFSNTGAKSVHVGAPGTNIYSTVPGNKYAKLNGTSMACPHVAGAAALLWAQFPNADYREIKRRLMESGDALSALAGKTISGRRINVARAVGATN